MEKKYFTLILLNLLFTFIVHAQLDCEPSTAVTQLDVNNVSATIGHSGNIWPQSYTIPSNTPDLFAQSPLFLGGLWLGGLDLAGNLKVAASTYGATQGQGARDFWPGPLNPNIGGTNQIICTIYDRFWEVSQEEIDAFLSDLADGGDFSSVYENILSWPARGNPFSANPPQGDLAPFVDVDGDGIYNPANGDYPSIYGDRAIWWVFNDAGNLHFESQGDVIQAEIQVMAYAFDSEIEAINNTTFYDFKITNRALEPIDSFFAGIWLDPALGCATDDYVGCIPEENLAFVYNEDATDGDVGCSCASGVNTYCGEIPLFGLKLIRGPMNEQGEELGMSSFIAINNGGLIPTPPPGTTDPNNAMEYYNYLTGSWRDGNSMTTGGDGYLEDSPETKFLYPGNPASENAWSMCTEGSRPGGQRMLSSVGPMRLDPGESASFCYALLFVPGVEHPCPDITPLIDAGNAAEEFCGLIATSTKEQFLSEGSILQFPNPMRTITRLELRNNNLQITGFQLFDALGRKLRVETTILGHTIEVKRSGLESGIYFYQLSTTKGKLATGKLIVQ